MANAPYFVEGKLEQKKVVLFMKTYIPEACVVKGLLEQCNILTEDNYACVDIQDRSDCSEVEDYLWKLSGKNNREVPLLFVNKTIFGGYYEIYRHHEQGSLERALSDLLAPEEEVTPLDSYPTTFVTIREMDDTEIIVKVTEDLLITHQQPDATFDPLVHKISEESLKSDLQKLFQDTEFHVWTHDRAVSGLKLNYLKQRMSLISSRRNTMASVPSSESEELVNPRSHEAP